MSSQMLNAQEKSTLIIGTTAHIGNGEVIRDAAIGFRNGKIDLVTAIDYRLDTTKYEVIIRLNGQHSYPGFISPNNVLGLVEIDAVRATRDANEVGNITPQVRSLVAYNTDSKIIPTVRSNGVLIVQSTPQGGRISGTSSIFNLDGWNWEDAVLKMDDAIHINWPSVYNRKWENGTITYKENKEFENQVNELVTFFKNAEAYTKSDFILETNLRFEAMRPVFTGDKKVFIHANNAKELSSAIYFIREQKVKSPVLVGAYDALLVADLLVDYKIPVVLRRVHELPLREDDAVDLPYQLPALLAEKGVKFCLQNDGSMQAMGTRNLPFYAGTAAAHGLDREEALKSISLHAAQILGIDQQVGSLEPGKRATLFVSEGDALDMRTNQLSAAFVSGKMIDLGSHQRDLYERYMKKYGLEPN
ncbi:amidohydrolase family protein [Vicingaceae bacterium]|nr:amidohydrolase family protein [Vicingaceae bacterium]